MIGEILLHRYTKCKVSIVVPIFVPLSPAPCSNRSQMLLSEATPSGLEFLKLRQNLRSAYETALNADEVIGFGV